MELKNFAQKFYLRALALALERNGVSDRAAALIANATLEDVGLISSDRELIIDKMTLRRQREKKRKKWKLDKKNGIG